MYAHAASRRQHERLQGSPGRGQDKMIDLAETLNAACVGCHRKWRDRKTAANRCK